MKTATVAFVLHKKVDDIYLEMKKKLKEVLSRLIEEENAETFLLTNKSFFDYFCLHTLTDLKRYYPLIKRVLVKARYEYDKDFDEAYLLTEYDELYTPEKGCYSNRYHIMVDKCDILVTYYEGDYKLLKGKAAGTKNAVEYALKENKRIINLAD